MTTVPQGAALLRALAQPAALYRAPPAAAPANPSAGACPVSADTTACFAASLAGCFGTRNTAGDSASTNYAPPTTTKI